MSGLFGGGNKAPSPPPPPPVPPPPDPLPPPPERSTADTGALAEKQRNRFFRRGGRQATMLTGGEGADSGSAATRFLGGSART